MKRFRSVSVSLSLMACLGMLVPQAALAELSVAKPRANKTMDVSLHNGGLLVGQLVSPQGTAKEGAAISLMYKGRELARTKTDKLGRFAVKGLNGGRYTLATAGSLVPVRAWTKTTAPPTAAVGALLVEGVTVRGQYPTLANPLYDDSPPTPNTTTYHVGGEGTAPAPPEEVTDVGQTTSQTTETYSSAPYSSGPYTNGHVHHAPHGGYHNGYHGTGYATGGHGGGGFLGFGMRPWLIGAGVAAAIAIPVALDDDDDDAS